MKNDYLWDGSGEPDPEIREIENLLRPLHYNRPQPDFLHAPASEPVPRRYDHLWLPTRRQIAYAGAALLAAVIILSVGLWHFARGPSCQVVSIAGAPRVGAARIGENSRLSVGQLLETDASSRAQIQISDVGRVEVEPNTRIRLEQSREDEHILSLQRGVMHALIWAPPRQFLVDTPSARAVDLGCAYTLEVHDDGSGLLRVTAGWVAFESEGRESFVPAGAMCLTFPKTGAGTPFLGDASPAFRQALENVDLRLVNEPAEAGSLPVLLSQARKEDALTLWHLLSRLDAEGRTLVYARLAQLVPAPPGVTLTGILARNRDMLDLWWNKLGLGDAQFWRRWERSYSGRK